MGFGWMYRHWTNAPDFDLVEAVHRTRANPLQRASKVTDTATGKVPAEAGHRRAAYTLNVKV